MKRWALILFFLLAAGTLVWLATRRGGPPEVPFAKARRERLVSQVSTNGKVEPLVSEAARAEREGLVAKVPVERGQTVAAGAILATLETREVQAEIASAEARVAVIRAELATFDRGGRSAEIAEIEGSVQKVRADLAKVEKDLAVTRRLVEKKAAPASEATELEDRRRRLQVELDALELRRRSLTAESDRTATQSRLKDAEAGVELAKRKAALGVIRAPMSGVVYNIAVRPGAYVQPGDVVAEVGRLDRLRVVVYVDEPEMGQVRQGQPVLITWDAKAGREWKGVVDRTPTQIVPFGTRQVGEVITVAENPEKDLLPGANVNAQVETRVVENALTVPKEALRPENSEFGLFVLAADGQRLEWRKVKLGATSATRAEVVSGLREGEAVALPTEQTLRAGEAIRAVYP